MLRRATCYAMHGHIIGARYSSSNSDLPYYTHPSLLPAHALPQALNHSFFKITMEASTNTADDELTPPLRLLAPSQAHAPKPVCGPRGPQAPLPRVICGVACVSGPIDCAPI